MKEHPILFRGPMVKAILAGTKTQTRRIVKPQPVDGDRIIHTAGGWEVGRLRDSENAWRDLKCPHGKPGERLWVRETHSARHGCVEYRADRKAESDAGLPWGHIYDEKIRWTPSIFMKREHSRITLEITDVRVERLQDISEEGAIAEGTQEPSLCALGGELAQAAWTERQVYSRLWNKINGKGAWDLNQWVWVISFKRVSA